jgi:hypothetical protein
LDITWCVRDDATASQLSAIAQRIQQASNALWHATEGLMYLRNVNLKDQSTNGEVVLDNLNDPSADGSFAYTFQLGGGAWEIHLGGAYPMQAFLHEIGHGEVLQDWTLPEEYDLAGSPCPVCAMDAYILGSGEGKTIYCHGGNCTTTRNGCWETVILATHSAWRFPNTHGSAPVTTVTIQNQ